ncbi:MAG: HAD-IIA family hydrolase [Chloroflexi bacterium]|nr:HAD-IIA family hydrolase [Chloroflexota bacterium]
MLNFETIQSVIFDMDGVLWRGNEPLPGIPEIFDFLDSRTIGYAFATNNSSRTQQMYIEKLAGFGVKATSDQIVTSAVATAIYCHNEFPDAKRVYIIGGEGMVEAFQQNGFEIVDAEQADLVAVGIDRNLTYQKLHRASYQIQGGAVLVGSNPDVTFPEPHGFAPGAGSILAAIEAATGVKPIIVGKPYTPMFEAAVQVLGTRPEHTLMIGDRLETDIVGAAQADLKSILVLTGVSSEADVAHLTIKPDAIYENLMVLLEAWQG